MNVQKKIYFNIINSEVLIETFICSKKRFENILSSKKILTSILYYTY